MALERTDPALVNHVLAEHRALFRRVGDLRARLAAPRPPGAAARAAVVGEVEALRRHLADHFAREEAGGLLEESVARLPRLATAAGAVIGEHAGLLARLDAVVKRLARGGRHAWTAAGADFAAFAVAVREHERRETTIFEEGHVEDLGLDG